jgi:hypothetical protein
MDSSITVIQVSSRAAEHVPGQILPAAKLNIWLRAD